MQISFEPVCAYSVAQKCPTPCYPMDFSVFPWNFPGKRLPFPTPRVSWPRDWNHISCVSCIGRRILYPCTTWEDHPLNQYHILKSPPFLNEFDWHFCDKSNNPLYVGLFLHPILFCSSVIYLITFSDDVEIHMDLRKVSFPQCNFFFYCSMS